MHASTHARDPARFQLESAHHGRTGIRIALLTRTCGISPAATAWYTVDVLTRSIAASSRTETHRTDSASTTPDCTKDVPSGGESVAKRCKKGLLGSGLLPAFPAACEPGRAPAIHS